MTPADLAKFEPQRHYATLVAVAVESTATVTDEIIDLHDRIIGKIFNTAKNRHQQQFQASGKALMDAKENGADPFAAIESVLPWDAFTTSVTEAQKLAQPEGLRFTAPHRRKLRNAAPGTGATAPPRHRMAPRFKTGGRAQSTGHVKPKYGTEPGRMFYTPVSDHRRR